MTLALYVALTKKQLGEADIESVRKVAQKAAGAVHVHHRRVALDIWCSLTLNVYLMSGRPSLS